MIVKRGTRRLLILKCTCGCGDELLINLDTRTGPAWRLYIEKGIYSLYPSYWRDTACHSHFIIWRNSIYWFYKSDEWQYQWTVKEESENAVLRVLDTQHFKHYLQVSDECGLVPWECLQACRQLVDKGLCDSQSNKEQEFFKKLVNNR